MKSQFFIVLTASSVGMWNIEEVHMDIHEGLCKTCMALS